jgi:hypothetical protein
VLLAPVVALGACTSGGDTDADPGPTPSATPTATLLSAEVAAPAQAATVVPDGTATSAALAAADAFFTTAPVVVLSGPDPVDLAPAASAAVALGAPLLPVTEDDAAVADRIDALGAAHVLLVGDDAARAVADGPLAEATADLAVHAAASGDDLAALGVALGDPAPVATAGLVGAVRALDRPDVDLLVEEDAASAGTATPAPTPTGVALPPSIVSPLGDPAAPTRAAAPAPTGGDEDDALAHVRPPGAVTGTALLVDPTTDPSERSTAAVATARAAGVPVVDVPGGDPRAASASVQALTGTTSVLALGSTFGTDGTLAPRLAAAATGVEVPGGGQLVFPGPGTGDPGKLYVALYGTPGTPALGVLGEQDVPATIARAKQTADQYAALTGRTVVPTLEIIATIASSGPEADGSYSRRRPVEDLRPLVEAAGEAGMAVVIDLQPGRTDFVTQAQEYADLLAYPHVGLALDPEWRLAPDQVHLRQIGSVGIDEVNATGDWLAQFTRDRALPQKMFLLHQFSLRMITERERLDTGHDELAVIIHADGQGSQPAKTGTWNALRQGAPPVHWGWKNFYDEDVPMLDPAQTMQVQPVPDLVTYQ